MARSVLLLLNQMPQDPASGAARNLRTQCEVLASAGFRVRSLATTATEHGEGGPVDEVLSGAGCAARVRKGGAGGCRVLEFENRGVSYTLLDVGGGRPQAWEERHGETFDRMLLAEMDEHPPEVVLTFGGQRNEVRRRMFVRTRGAAVVLAVLNFAYMDRRAFRGVDAVVTPSEHASARYREGIGLVSTALPSPIDPGDVVAEEREPKFLTYINPSVQKGVVFFARVAEEIGRTHPEIPMLIVESRGTAGMLLEAGERGGFDLRRHASMMVSAGVAQPKHIYAVTRVLVVPSVGPETYGRVAAEAVLNGIPPIVSDRGGLPEASSGGGFVVPIPESVTMQSTTPPDAAGASAWTDLAVRLMTDDAFYGEARARAEVASASLRPEALRGRILGFYSRVVRSPGETPGPLVEAGA